MTETSYKRKRFSLEDELRKLRRANFENRQIVAMLMDMARFYWGWHTQEDRDMVVRLVYGIKTPVEPR